MVPCILTPYVGVLCEESGHNISCICWYYTLSGTHLDPKGGLSAETSCTEDAVFEILACASPAMIVQSLAEFGDGLGHGVRTSCGR